MQADAGNQYGGHGHQSDGVIVGGAHVQDRALVFAKQLFHPLQRNRVDVPGVAIEVVHPV